MPMLHDNGYRAQIQKRLGTLSRGTKPRWGKMSVDQMLWHVSDGMEVALGRRDLAKVRTPLPKPVMKFLLLNVPWPKGMPTHPQYVATREYDFDQQRQRCLALIDEISAKDLNAVWPAHPVLGKVDGRFNSRLHAKHLNHHLNQFGA